MSDSKINQNGGIFLKTGTTPEDLKIYELYLGRWGKEADLIWRRFQIFWGGLSVILLAMAFLLTSSFHGQDGQSFSFGFNTNLRHWFFGLADRSQPPFLSLVWQPRLPLPPSGSAST